MSRQAHATANVCFCHIQSNPPQTICTDNSGQQNGHYGHGDYGFGCECGDGVCDANYGEDCQTCAIDCGACATCGDGVIDEGEECGEEGLGCEVGACIGCRCVTTCGDEVVNPGELCDGGECCLDCQPSPGEACDDGLACTDNDICQADGSCSGEAVGCDDGNNCTTDSCDDIEGCLHEALDCNDGLDCTVDSCDQSAGCVNIPDDSSCDDSDDCTLDICDVVDGCQHPVNDLISECTVLQNDVPEAVDPASEGPVTTDIGPSASVGGDGWGMGCSLIRNR